MKKQSSIAGFSNAQYVPDSKKGYAQYQSFNRKDTIIRYIEIIAVCLMVITLCAGLYDASR